MRLKNKKLYAVVVCVFLIVMISKCREGMCGSNDNILKDWKDGFFEPTILEYYQEDITDVETLTNGSISIKYVDVDLNDDEQIDKIVFIRSPLHTGTKGDTLNILINEQGEYRLAVMGVYSLFSQEDEVVGAIYILKNRNNNFHDIKIVEGEAEEILLYYTEGRYQQKFD